MTTIHEALALAKTERVAGHIKDFWIAGRRIYAESPDGGTYTWFDPIDDGGEEGGDRQCYC